jgi:hypothetical protein
MELNSVDTWENTSQKLAGWTKGFPPNAAHTGGPSDAAVFTQPGGAPQPPMPGGGGGGGAPPGGGVGGWPPGGGGGVPGVGELVGGGGGGGGGGGFWFPPPPGGPTPPPLLPPLPCKWRCTGSVGSPAPPNRLANGQLATVTRACAAMMYSNFISSLVCVLSFPDYFWTQTSENPKCSKKSPYLKTYTRYSAEEKSSFYI